MKTKLMCILLFSLLITTLLPLHIFGVETGQSLEYIDIFIDGNGVLWRVSSNNIDINISNTLNISEIDTSYISKIRLIFYIYNEWKGIYNMFFESKLFKNTTLNYVEGTKTILEIYHKDKKASYNNAQSIADRLSFYFHLNFMLLKTETNKYVFVSSYDPKTLIGNKKLFNLLKWNLTGIFSLIDTNAFIKNDFSIISITINLNNEPEVEAYFLSLTIDENINTGQFRLSDIFPKISGGFTTRNDTTTVVRIYFRKNINLLKYPLDYILKKVDDTVISLSKTYNPKSIINDIVIKLKFSIPVLIIERYLNVTSLKPGIDIKITLKIYNAGPVNAYNISLYEAPWWDQYTGIILKTGSGSWEIKELAIGTYKEFMYVVQITNMFNNTIVDIGAAQAKIKMESANMTLNYFSSTTILYSEDTAPLIYVTLSDFSDLDLTYDDDLSFYVTLSNVGNDVIKDINIGNIYLPELKPNDTRKIEFRVEVKDDLKNMIYLNYTITYRYKNKDYIINSPITPIMFKPNNTFSPAVNLNYVINSTANGEFNITYNIKNIGLSAINKIYVTGFSFSKIKFNEYVIYENQTFQYDLGYLLKGDEISFTIYISEKNILTYTPNIYLILYNNESSIFTFGIEPVINAVKIHIKEYPQELLQNLKYNTTIFLYNNGPYAIYDVNLDLTYSNLNILLNKTHFKYIKGNTKVAVNVSISSNNIGIASIDKITISYVYGGIRQEVSINGSKINVVSGIDVKVDYNNIVVEGDVIDIKLQINRDTQKITVVNILWALPDGITLLNGSKNYSSKVVINDTRAIIHIKLKAVSPGLYNLKPPIVSFKYNNYMLSISNLGKNIGNIKILVKENVVIRYWIYFIIGLIIAISSGLYVRNRILR